MIERDWSSHCRGTRVPQSVIASEPLIRLGFFLSIFLLMAAWERLKPRRPQAIGRRCRWPNNLGLVALNTLAVRLVFPFAGVGIAFLAQTKGWGLFNIVPLPAWLNVPATVVLLDLVIYGQHVAFHAVPVLWRLHRLDRMLLQPLRDGARVSPQQAKMP
jgi:sterol desaturase/sphingolipid hydroxylase (fatty acid hydroxylase superfamily)